MPRGWKWRVDFEGDTFDLPSEAENSDEEEGQDEDEDQRLDQEMGDVGQEGQVSIHSALRRQAYTCIKGAAIVMLACSS